MIRSLATLLTILALTVALPAAAAELQVAEGVITTQIVDRAPVDTIESFPASVGQLYCFTRITGAESETTVTHVWYHEDEEMARIELRVASSDWRTWSSKKILSQWTGSWRVEVRGADGRLLKSIPFTLL